MLYLLGSPAMMLGLGIYLPFYMSLTAFLGAMAKMAYDAVCERRRARLRPTRRPRGSRRRTRPASWWQAACWAASRSWAWS